MWFAYPTSIARDPEAIGNILVATASGEQIPLSRLATIRVAEGPSQIAREWGQRRINISANVRGRDIGSFVAEAQEKIAEQVDLPEGRYHIEWGGQFENLLRARQRLLVVVPVALVLIFTLLYMTYHNVVDTVRVFTGVPFAWTGGIFALWLRDMPFSISAAIGFVALSGVAVLDDMLLVSYIRQLRSRGADLETAVEKAAMTRLRPVLMTSLVASLGFVPDGIQHRDGSGSSAATSNGRHWRCHQRDRHVAIGAARAVHGFQKSRRTCDSASRNGVRVVR